MPRLDMYKQGSSTVMNRLKCTYTSHTVDLHGCHEYPADIHGTTVCAMCVTCLVTKSAIAKRHRKRKTMKKASALTAALSGKQNESVPAASDDAAKHTESFSFPCLDRNGKQTAYGLDDVAEELGKSSLKGQSIAGSAPTAVVLPNGSIAVSWQQPGPAGAYC